MKILISLFILTLFLNSNEIKNSLNNNHNSVITIVKEVLGEKAKDDIVKKLSDEIIAYFLKSNLKLDKALTNQNFMIKLEKKVHESVKQNISLTELLIQSEKGKRKLLKGSNSLESNNLLVPLYIQKLDNIEMKILDNSYRQKLIKKILNFVRHNYKIDSITHAIHQLDDINTLDLLKELEELQIEEKSLAIEYNDEYPKLIGVRRQIERMREKIIDNLHVSFSLIDDENHKLLQKKEFYEKKVNSFISNI